MMRKFFTASYLVFSLGLIIYLVVYPGIKFPDPPPNSTLSVEPGDSETPYRRAYFTDYNRSEVIEHYRKQFDYLPILRLNYPPEDAQTIIRDRTRSVYLEELTHPFRESIFINGFIPSSAKDDIWYKGRHYEQKITVRFVPSMIVRRILINVITLVLGWMIVNEWVYFVKNSLWIFR
ncbi:MAG: hypothetical protein UV74_C0013G0303 [Candidatus Woesebacteria bacterium GW2011_GWB1_43_14]|uniref:Uncharacterized protein n=1 Tax=Candidatus Woesebacteria bacterium GW2011_GWB1_43_14 TaxID=1618578 RepID=A0A0G1FQ81_9BACT|nr:MAG: hypothetical protein UT21_C0001G0013 [Candidatus Woesebacteria bacterium GW2011_GWA1_39_11b]KKS78402.1 MAG: hypothetical protein UV51_C0001G0118 [Candidatus Woesebacteria bacterium GW2011_GWC1_42_9]KKS97181.1 MAG: hypothetical protein UV74_C0013G0303 [Candidatus Woesebacteria bacterium GW2011_GWB1_43_14]